MKRCELLSPAGNMEMLKFAVQYGADAVYLAGTRFGARKFANNFNDEELTEAVKYAHLYNVKVYITINTLVYESEIDDFVENVKFIHSLGVDAVIVQDFGMLNLIKKFAPNLEIHASTQFHNDGEDTIKFLQKCGVKRAVLDREMALSEIEKLTNIMEIEIFCHGALCVSYSGQCLFSSQVLGRSGNRGECAGLCRLPYKIKENDKLDKEAEYHLSLKDLNTTGYIYDILDRNVASLKIEGRMKSPEYVGYMTMIYRKLIDSYYDGTRITLTEEEMRNIEILFNRGMTKGFMADTENEEIVNRLSPNHIGIHMGFYRPYKNKIELDLEYELHQGDTIRFSEDNKGMTVNFLYDKKDKLINCSQENTLAYVDNFLGIKETGELRLVGSGKLTEQIDKLPIKKIPIDFEFIAHQNANISLTAKEREYCVSIEGPMPEIAKRRPIKEEDITRQLGKTGSTVYEVRHLKLDLDDNLFLNLSDLNEIRRKVLDKLDEVRTSPNPVIFNNLKEGKPKTESKKLELIAVVSTEEQYEEVKKYTNLIFSKNKNLTMGHPDVYPKYVDCHQTVNNSKYMVSDYGLLVGKKENDVVFTDYMMNVTNSYTVKSLVDLGITGITVSIETELPQLKLLSEHVDMSKIAILIYGNIELMKMKYNPLKKRGNSLIDRNGAEYRVTSDEYYNYLMSSNPIDRIEDMKDYSKLQPGYYRLDFTVESREKCSKILEKVHKNILKE